jgi:uncharacterized membrane protein (UPF0127 family)
MTLKRLIITLASLIACSNGAPATDSQWTSPVAFDTGTVHILTNGDSLELTVEIARTSDQRAFGLMTRPSLDSLSGMLFLYEARQDSSGGFWMFRTLIPLDIAFMDSTGTIVTIRSMEPCTSPNPEWCPEYAPDAAYWSALEVNRGFFARHGIAEGHRVRLR